MIALFLLLPFGLPSAEELGPLLFFLVILTEVIVAPIPGGVIAFVGSAQLGFWVAWPILYAGNVIGSNVLFHLARRFGRPFVERHTKRSSGRNTNGCSSGTRGSSGSPMRCRSSRST